ncbi:MAG: tetracycline resistance MFS efflux pump [Rhodobiaceae bacterium]|nr:MAG: tetracycline resistance MFS efflux pump [Rhodobiaceae bacterium]
MRTPSRNAMAFVLITVMIDTIGFGIIIPVLPRLVMELTGEPISAAAGYGGVMLFAFAAAHFLFAPLMGNLSDRFGRRPILIISLAALGVDYLVMGFAPSIAWLFAGRVFAGLFGATFATANAYITDVTEPDKRAQAFALIGAAWGLGFIIGPAIGGFLGEIGPRIPFFAAAGLAFCNVIYGLLVLPETLAEENRRSFDWRRANPVGALAHFRTYPLIIGLAIVMVLFQIAGDANPAIFTYYAIYKFGWSERDIGFALTFVGVTVIFSQTILIRWTVKTFGEINTAYIGLIVAALGFAALGLATESWMAYAALVPMAFMGLAMPPIRSLMTTRVPDNAQGELQGAIASLMGLTMIATPLIMTQLFSSFTGVDAPIDLPGAPYFLAALMMLMAALMLTRYTRDSRP